MAYIIALCSVKLYPKGAYVSLDYFSGWQLLQYTYSFSGFGFFLHLGAFKIDGRLKARTDAL